MKSAIKYLNGALWAICFVFSQNILADEVLQNLLASEDWQSFKSLIVEGDAGVKKWGQADTYCETLFKEQPYSNMESLFLACASGFLKHSKSRSTLYKIPAPTNQAQTQRANIQAKNLGENTAYLRIDSFLSNSHIDFLQVLKSLEAQHQVQFTHMLLDLRANSGGALLALEGMAGLFMGEGKKILKLVDRKNKVTEVLETSLKSQSFPPTDISVPAVESNLKKIKLVVLIDANTASGAEALAFLLQQQGAQLMGTKTQGEAYVYSVRIIGDLLLKLHSDNLYTVKNQTWAEVGVVPTIILQDVNIAQGDFGNPEVDTWLILAQQQLAK